MSEGAPHPSALKKTIESKTEQGRLSASSSITGHRLASTVQMIYTNSFQLKVWDWRTGELLFVRKALVWCIHNFDGIP